MAPSPEDFHPKVESEDDVSWIDNQLLQSALEYKAVITDIDVTPAVGKGDNYLSVIYRTRVEYRLPDSNDVHIKDLIVKMYPPGDLMKKYVEEIDAFGREIILYSDVLPKLYAFADSLLGSGSFKRLSADFYHMARKDIVLLGDLKSQGFVMASRKNRLDYTHAKLVLQNLARFHALTLAYSECYPEFLSDFVESAFSESNRERFNQFLPPILKSIVDAVKKWEGFDEIANKLGRLQDTLVDKLIQLNKPSDEFTNVLIHGDCWVNNILFNYSDLGEPIDLRFVDFQIARQASPALELHYFLFSSLQNQVRIRHFDDLLRDYYEEFTIFGKKFGYSGTVFTFEDLRKEMKRTIFIGFYSTLTTMAAAVAEPEEAPDMGSFTEEDMASGNVQMFDKIYENPLFRESFEDLLPYFDKHGVFE